MSDTIIVPDRRKAEPLPGFPWWVLPGLAGMVLIIFAGALAASCVLQDDTLRTQMFTGAYGLATMSVGYFFGSSAGSAKKDDAIAASAAKPAVLTTTKTEAPPPPPEGGTAKPMTTTTQTQTGGTP
jgi:hypothetical protein